ncbi:MAG TPA: cysteine hydrolase [Acidimicrobiia bacterium]|jgi:nicotinamidase-related amidase
MPVDLATLVAPDHTAVLTMEMQRGVVGDLSPIPELADEVERAGVVKRAAELLGAARAHGARVVHCTAEFRADRAGSATNCPMLAVMARQPGHLLVGSDAARVVDALGPEPGDFVSSRLHGISPFTGTALDATLRNLGVTTVVATGVSVNLGVLGLAIEAVNLGYRVVVATDAVAGVPRDYADLVMNNTIALLATRASVTEIVHAWDR